MKFGGEFTREDARLLLEKKLQGIHASTQNVIPEHSWYLEFCCVYPLARLPLSSQEETDPPRLGAIGGDRGDRGGGVQRDRGGAEGQHDTPHHRLEEFGLHLLRARGGRSATRRPPPSSSSWLGFRSARGEDILRPVSRLDLGNCRVHITRRFFFSSFSRMCLRIQCF